MAEKLRVRRWLIGFACVLSFSLPVPAENASRYTTVVIDAGHGGFDRGGIPGQRVAEKIVALDVAQRLQRKLDQAGYHTIMTRDSDVFVPLPERVRIANRQRNAIFVCVHFNSAGRAAANGIETYYYSRESAPLAASIHRCVVSGSGTENRGVRQRGYFVLRRTAIPAVLVECGFLTNPHEAMLAETAGYRQRLADEIASGIRGQPALAARRAGSASSVAMAAAYSSSSYRVDSNGTRVLASADAAASVHSRVRHSRHSAARAHSSAKKKSSARAKTGRKSSSSHLHRKTTQKKKESNE